MNIKTLAVVVWFIILGFLVWEGRSINQKSIPYTFINETVLGAVTEIKACKTHKRKEICDIKTNEGFFPNTVVSDFPDKVLVGDYLTIETYRYSEGGERIYHCRNGSCSVTRVGFNHLNWAELLVMGWFSFGLLAFMVLILKPFKGVSEPYDNREFLS